MVKLTWIIVDAVLGILNVRWVLNRLLCGVRSLQVIVLGEVAHLAAVAASAYRSDEALSYPEGPLLGLIVVTVPYQRSVLFLLHGRGTRRVAIQVILLEAVQRILCSRY